MKGRDGKSQTREEKRTEDQRGEIQKKEDLGSPKGRKVVKHPVFSMVCGSGGSKSRLAKAASVERSGQMRDEKMHAVVVRSTCPSQSTKHTRFGALLGVEMSKKGTPLWRKVHVEDKGVKN